MNSADFSLTDLIACAEREVSMRRNVYRGRVLAGSMTQEDADRETGMMDAILGHLQKLAAAGPLFRETWALMAQLPADVAPLLDKAPSFREVCDAEPAQCRALATQQAAIWLRVATKLPTGPAAPVQPQLASAPQKEELLRLMNHPCNSRQDKTKLMLNINKLTTEQAREKIAALKTKAEAYDGAGEVAGLIDQVRKLVQEKGEALALPECERLLALCEKEGVTATELRDNLAAAVQELNSVAA